MNTKQVINGVVVLLLVGMALDAAHAATGSTEPAVEIRAVESNAPTLAEPTPLPESNAIATPVKAESAPASQSGEANAAAATDVPAPKPDIVERTVNGVVSFFERARAFLFDSDK